MIEYFDGAIGFGSDESVPTSAVHEHDWLRSFIEGHTVYECSCGTRRAGVGIVGVDEAEIIPIVPGPSTLNCLSVILGVPISNSSPI